MLDGVEFGNEIVALVRGYVEREIAPMRAENEAMKERLKALEDHPAPEKGEAGEPGQDGTAPEPEAVAAAMLPIAEELIADAVAKAIAELPPPEKGEPGEPGKDIDPALVGGIIETEVAKAFAALPVPKDGEPGKDAANIVEALKHDGELVLTLQDGRLIRTGIRDGRDGKRGRDGFGFDDMDACVLDDDRTIELSFRRGDEEKAFTFKWPAMIYRGVWREGTFSAGDSVTWGGSLWVAEKETGAKPDTSDSGWKLAVKKGRDGKDAKPNG